MGMDRVKKRNIKISSEDLFNLRLGAQSAVDALCKEGNDREIIEGLAYSLCSLVDAISGGYKLHYKERQAGRIV